MIDTNYISTLVEDYIEFKRSLGFELKIIAKRLRIFASYTRTLDYDGYITKDLVLKWICKGTDSQKTRGRRMEMFLPFLKFAHLKDENNEIIYSQIFSNARQRPNPHIYNESEVLDLIRKCENLYSPDQLRIKSMQLALGLLWATGMRPNEVVSLKYKDIDFENGLIKIRDTKLHKDRIIPIHETVLVKIKEYISFINSHEIYPEEDDNLLYTTYHKIFTFGKMYTAFKLIRGDINTSDSDYDHARLYDFRHSFASRTIYQWLKSDEDVNEKLYILSCYLGHAKISDTYWYLSSSLLLMSLASEKYEKMVGD